MSISGNLKTMELAELLQWVAQGQKTGTLIIDSGAVNKKVFFEGGAIVASGSTDPSEQLGHFLVSHGYITELELTKAMEMQEETGMLLGKILVTIGGITEEELRHLLVLKTEESIYDMFSWKEAEFRFVDDENLSRGMIPLALDVTGITLQGMNRVDEWNRIRKVIPHDQAVPVIFGKANGDGLSPGDQRVLELINDDRTIQEICLQTHSSEFYVSRTLFRQFEKGIVKIVVPRTQDTGSGPTLQPSLSGPSSSGMPIVNAQTLLKAGETHISGQEFQKGLRYLRAARSLEPDNQKVLKRIKQLETQIEAALHQAGLDLTAIPKLEREVQELTSLKLSPEEGFLLTRIDGSNTIQQLLKISPLDPLDAQLVFFKLVQEGHIKLQAAPV
ncbi:MAG: DUF4388 domain-containing protein [Acidobacteriota bacterium]